MPHAFPSFSPSQVYSSHTCQRPSPLLCSAQEERQRFADAKAATKTAFAALHTRYEAEKKRVEKSTADAAAQHQLDANKASHFIWIACTELTHIHFKFDIVHMLKYNGLVSYKDHMLSSKCDH